MEGQASRPYVVAEFELCVFWASEALCVCVGVGDWYLSPVVVVVVVRGVRGMRPKHLCHIKQKSRFHVTALLLVLFCGR